MCRLKLIFQNENKLNVKTLFNESVFRKRETQCDHFKFKH